MSASVADNDSEREMIEFSEDEHLSFFYNIDQVIWFSIHRYILNYQELYLIMEPLHNPYWFADNWVIRLLGIQLQKHKREYI